MENSEEKALIKRSKCFDKYAFGELVDSYQGIVYGFILKRINNKDLAFDLAQEVFLKAYMYIESFDLERPFLPWLLKIATNECMDYFNKEKRGRSVDFSTSNDEKIFNDGFSCDDFVDTLELLDILALVDENSKVVLEMFYFKSQSIKSIAQKLKISEGAVKVRLLRARERVRALWQERRV